MKRVCGLGVFAGLMLGVCSVTHAGMIFEAFLDGPSESPPNASPGTGFATLIIDETAHTFTIDVTFSDLIAPTTAAHIHAPTAMPFMGTAGVATQVPTFSGFPAGVTSGTYMNTFDTTMASTFNPAFVTATGGTVAGAETALFTAVREGRAYLNIHTTAFPGGEIRGFFVAVPEPSTLGLFLTGGLALVFAGRRWKQPKREGE
jgi:hypothetical protein